MHVMLVKLAAGIVALSLAACAVDDQDHLSIVVEETPVGTRSEAAVPVDERICDLLPDDPQAVCTYACDPDALTDFVPEGLCVKFACELTTGETILVSACHPRSEPADRCDDACASNQTGVGSRGSVTM